MRLWANIFKNEPSISKYKYECNYKGYVGIFFKVPLGKGITSTQIKTLVDQTSSTEDYIFVTVDSEDFSMVGFINNQWFANEYNYDYHTLEGLIEDFGDELSNQTGFTCEYEDDFKKTYWQMIGYTY